MDEDYFLSGIEEGEWISPEQYIVNNMNHVLNGTSFRVHLHKNGVDIWLFRKIFDTWVFCGQYESPRYSSGWFTEFDLHKAVQGLIEDDEKTLERRRELWIDGLYGEGVGAHFESLKYRKTGPLID